jgi:hypothetical protein
VAGGVATEPPDLGGGTPVVCPYKVVRTNGSDGVLARAANLLIGRAAFETAKRMYPRDLIEYRRGAQVIGRSEPSQGRDAKQ